LSDAVLAPHGQRKARGGAATGDPQSSYDKPNGFVTALRDAMTAAPDIELLFGVWEQNVATLRILSKSSKPEPGKTSVAESLVAHLKSCARALVKPHDEATTLGIDAAARGDPICST
jgi:hypothetical protein